MWMYVYSDVGSERMCVYIYACMVWILKYMYINLF